MHIVMQLVRPEDREALVDDDPLLLVIAETEQEVSRGIRRCCACCGLITRQMIARATHCIGRIVSIPGVRRNLICASCAEAPDEELQVIACRSMLNWLNIEAAASRGSNVHYVGRA